MRRFMNLLIYPLEYHYVLHSSILYLLQLERICFSSIVQYTGISLFCQYLLFLVRLCHLLYIFAMSTSVTFRICTLAVVLGSFFTLHFLSVLIKTIYIYVLYMLPFAYGPYLQ